MPSISFPGLARTSSTSVNTSESRHPYPFPDLKRESFQSFSIEYDINYGFFINAFYHVEVIKGNLESYQFRL